MAKIKELQLTLSDQVADRLVEIRDQTGARTVPQVISRAVAVYDYLLVQQQAGAEIITRSGGVEKPVSLVP